MKDLSVGIIYLAVLLMPGIIASVIYRNLTHRPSRQALEDFIEIFLFASLSYLFYALLSHYILGMPTTIEALRTLQGIQSGKAEFVWQEILVCCGIGVAIGFAASYVYNYKIITWLGRKVRATKRYGEEDVWEYFHNLDKPHYWAYIKDHKTGMLYFGYICAFSASGEDRELILHDVEAFDLASGQWRFRRDVIYLSRDRFDLTIEIPSLNLPTRIDGEAGEEKNE